MPEMHRWRIILRQLLLDPQERLRIVRVLRVNNVTLHRWTTSSAKPRLPNLRQLVQALPEYREELISSIQEEFEDFTFEAVDLEELPSSSQDEQEIPTAFYTRVLHDYCYLPRPLRFTSLCDLILQQALNHLDPYGMGIEVTLALCMPPGGNQQKVRSLRESIGRGTLPWQRASGQRTLFLGSESLAGYVLGTGHFRVIQSRKEGHHLFPAHWVDGEESAMAHPIMNENCVAGCLIVSSSQPYYFTLFRQTLIQQYAELLVLACKDEQFYDLSNIALAFMPPYTVQNPYLATFRERVLKEMVEARREQHLNLHRAEELVWQQIEEELIHLQYNM